MAGSKGEREEGSKYLTLALPSCPQPQFTQGAQRGLPTNSLHSYRIPLLPGQSWPRFLPTRPLVQCEQRGFPPFASPRLRSLGRKGPLLCTSAISSHPAATNTRPHVGSKPYAPMIPVKQCEVRVGTNFSFETRLLQLQQQESCWPGSQVQKTECHSGPREKQ